MARFAYVEDGVIISVHDRLPTSWKNISNFHHFENRLDEIEQYGWKVIQQTTYYNPATHKAVSSNYYIKNGSVFEEKILNLIT